MKKTTIQVGYECVGGCGIRFFAGPMGTGGKCPKCGAEAKEYKVAVPTDLLAEVTQAKKDVEASEVPYGMSGRADMYGDLVLHRNMVQRWRSLRDRLWRVARRV